MRQAVQVRVPVDCPLCGLDVTVLALDVEPGQDLPPFENGGMVWYTSNPPRVTGLVLTCGCVVSYPPWVLCFPAPGARPFFRSQPS